MEVLALVVVLAVAMTTHGSSIRKPEECPQLNGSFNHEDPNNCHEYYECVNGVPILRMCPDGLYFDKSINTCDWAYKGFRSGCTGETYLNQVNEIKSAVHPFTPTSTATNQCPRLNGWFNHEDPTNCQEYYECAHGVPILRKCQDGLYFNEAISSCDWASKGFRTGCKKQSDEENIVQTIPNTQPTDKVLVCYFESWAVYRSKPFDFGVTDIDPSLCTHIIYSFAGLDTSTWGIKALDHELDIVKGTYKSFIGLKDKNPKLKALIAIGGWSEGGKSYSDMASKKERRQAFISSVISFMEEHQWDGLDLDWEYPGTISRGGHPSDKANFATLVKELSAEFKPRGWLLTAAVTPAGFRVDEGYDVPKIAQYIDYIFAMTYDLRGTYEMPLLADHHAPLSSRPHDVGDMKSLNTIDGLKYWHSKGMPMHKLVMGIPFYGRSFTLSSTSDTKHGAKAIAKGNKGNYTQENGYIAYYEICQERRNGGWEMARDSVGGPYLVKGDQWIGYDDTEYIATKMDVVHSMGLGGAFMWAIDLDDNVGVCGTKWPLLSTMRKGLYGSSVLEDSKEQNLLSDQKDVLPGPGEHIQEENVVQTNANPQSTDKKLVCYFGSWAVVKRPKPFDTVVTDIDPFSCTHVIYANAGLDNSTWGIKSVNPQLDIVKGAYNAAVGLKDKNPDLKVLIAFGRWEEGGKIYSDMASTKERRQAFISSVISFMQEHKWDGLDLHWEWPGASSRGGRPSDKANYAALVKELSAEFKPRGWLLTAAVSSAGFRVDEGYAVAEIAQDLDYIFLKTYDLRGKWDKMADHHSPLSSRDRDEGIYKTLTTKAGINYWNSKGAPMHKLVMGIPFYGRSFTLSSTSNTKPGAPILSAGIEGNYTQENDGYLAYYEICQEQRNGGWVMARDSIGGPYMVKGDQWIGFDDPINIATKMEAVHSMGLGGAFMWAIDLDDYLGVCGTKWPLLTAMRKGLYGSDSVPYSIDGRSRSPPLRKD